MRFALKVEKLKEKWGYKSKMRLDIEMCAVRFYRVIKCGPPSWHSWHLTHSEKLIIFIYLNYLGSKVLLSSKLRGEKNSWFLLRMPVSIYCLLIFFFWQITNCMYFLIGLYKTAIGTIWHILCTLNFFVSHYCYRFIVTRSRLIRKTSKMFGLD